MSTGVSGSSGPGGAAGSILGLLSGANPVGMAGLAGYYTPGAAASRQGGPGGVTGGGGSLMQGSMLGGMQGLAGPSASTGVDGGMQHQLQHQRPPLLHHVSEMFKGEMVDELTRLLFLVADEEAERQQVGATACACVSARGRWGS